jgi:UDP-glucose 4-epimerase
VRRLEKWFITGGAGYVGSHIADRFLADGKEVVIYDSFYNGSEIRIDYLKHKYSKDIPVIRADIRDSETLATSLEQVRPIGVIHTAALKSVSESVQNPDKYFDVNFEATRNLMQVMERFEVKRVVFSSTAAVYGSPSTGNAVTENNSCNPVSAYGASKLAAENEIVEFLKKTGNVGTSLRFFNVVGTAAPKLSDNSVENLIPIVFNKLLRGETISIFGTNYPTHDGTCVRDYVDVRDIANAHLAVANARGNLPLAMNVGTGVGLSVRDVISRIAVAAEISTIHVEEAEPREGDTASIFADVSLIKRSLGFVSQYDFESSIKSLLH